MKKLTALMTALLLALLALPAAAEGGAEYILPEADIAVTLPGCFTAEYSDNNMTYLYAVDKTHGAEFRISEGPRSQKDADILLRKMRDPGISGYILSEDMLIGRNRWLIYCYDTSPGWSFMLITEEGWGIRGYYYPQEITAEMPAELTGILASVRILSQQGETITAAGATFTMPADFTAQTLSSNSDFLYKAQNTAGAVFGVLAPESSADQAAWLSRLRSGDGGYLFAENVYIGEQSYLVYHSTTATSWNFWLETAEGYGAWFAYNDGAWQEAIPQTAVDILTTIQPAGK